MEESRSGPRGLEDPAVHHEESDVDVRAITRFGVALTLTIVASMFLLWGLFHYFSSREANKGAPPREQAGVDARQLPPEPRLETAPMEGIRALREAEDRILNSYAWIDPDNGVVRIPVGRAMELLARRGLPARTQPGPVSTDTASWPTDSSLGATPMPAPAGIPAAPAVQRKTK